MPAGRSDDDEVVILRGRGAAEWFERTFGGGDDGGDDDDGDDGDEADDADSYYIDDDKPVQPPAK